MALVAAAIVTSARDLHPAFDHRMHPDAMARRTLSRIHRETFAYLAFRVPELVVQSELIALPLADHGDGFALSNPYRAIHEIVVIPTVSTTGRTVPVELIDATQRHDRGVPMRAAWLAEGRIYLRSPASLWSEFSGVGVRYIPELGELSALTQSLQVPDWCEHYVVAQLAHAFSLRGHPDPAMAATLQPREFAAMVAAAREQVNESLVTRAPTLQRRETWP